MFELFDTEALAAAPAGADTPLSVLRGADGITLVTADHAGRPATLGTFGSAAEAWAALDAIDAPA